MRSNVRKLSSPKIDHMTSALIIEARGHVRFVSIYRRRHFPYIGYTSEPDLMWSCGSRTLGEDMLAARCLMLNSYLIDRYFSVHLTTNKGDVKLSTNVDYGRNGLWWKYSLTIKKLFRIWRRIFLMYTKRSLDKFI